MTIDLDITVRDNGARSWLASSGRIEDAIGQGLGEWAENVLDDQLYGEDKYAPPPPNSRYIRTGRLGRGFGLMRQGRTAVRFFNLVGHAFRVVGDAEGHGQAGIHAGRWWLARQRIEARLDNALDRIGRAIERVMR
jgi:hypothetical protein